MPRFNEGIKKPPFVQKGGFFMLNFLLSLLLQAIQF